MYRPNCAAQVDGMKFCRKCGTNVSLISQALTGRPPEEQQKVGPKLHDLDWGMGLGRKKRRKPPSVENAAHEFFGGLGMLFVALAIWQFFPGGKFWWFWMLIPAFAGIGKGVGQYLRARSEKPTFYPQSPPPQLSATPSEPPLPVPTTSELKLPEKAIGASPSITEHTTRHLEATPRRESERS